MGSLAAYLASRNGRIDEWAATHDEEAAHVYARLAGIIEGLKPKSLARYTRLARDLVRDEGVTYGALTSSSSLLPFDILPVVIGASEWARLEAGLSQRFRAWNALMLDLYNQQEILKAGVLPYPIVYEDPFYRRECVDLSLVGNTYIHLGAVDLIRCRRGRWRVIEDHIATPGGVSYALQNRQMLSQVFPSLMQGTPIAPIQEFPNRLLETLQAAAPASTAGARVVVLSPGPASSGYAEHSALARMMSAPLVQGGDLLVLNSEVFLKTIDGLDRIDVIYRCVESSQLDPVPFETASDSGVPGLLSCIRKGTVTVANAIGCGLGDNRAVAAYMPQIIEFFLGEPPLLDAVPHHHLADLDVREMVFDSPHDYTFKEVDRRGADTVVMGQSLSGEQWADLRRRIERRPEGWVVQARLDFSSTPVLDDEGVSGRSLCLRAYVMTSGNSVSVPPCLFARTSHDEHSLSVAASAGGGTKDAWVLRADDAREPQRTLVVRPPQRRLRLSSRHADALFWLGRYMERAEGTVRILRAVQTLQSEGAFEHEPKAWNPLWEALASATGHPTSHFKRVSFRKSKGVPLARYILLDRENLASVVTCLFSARYNAQAVRERLPLEVWSTLNRLYLHLADLGRTPQSRHLTRPLEERELHDEIIEGLDELSGAMEKHMPRNDAWHMLRVGRHAERGMLTLLTMRQVFLRRSRSAETESGYYDDALIDALLRMLSAQFAYRQAYRTRPVAALVASLLVTDKDFPRSVLHNLRGILGALRDIFGGRPSEHAEAPLRYAGHLVSEVNFGDLSGYFVRRRVDEDADSLQAEPTETSEDPLPRRMKRFVAWLDHVADRSAELNNLISDHYLSHQAATPPVLESQR